MVFPAFGLAENKKKAFGDVTKGQLRHVLAVLVSS